MISPNSIAWSSYYGDGENKNFVYPYPLNQISDLIVSAIIDDEIVVYAYSSDYTVGTQPDSYGSYPAGLTATFIVAPAESTLVFLDRKTDIENVSQFIDNGPFTAGLINHILDSFALMMQDIIPQFKGVANYPPSSGTYVVGDWFKHRAPTAAGNFGWVCTVGGSPGTWKTFGNISA